MPTKPDPAEQLRVSIELLWGWSRDARGRGPRPSLTLGRIVEAAVAVADRDGVDGLSMRRVASELGVGAMSLYRYVPGKTELLNLMLDAVSDPHTDPARIAGRPWRDVVEDVARGSYQLYLKHPWLMQVNWTRPVIGPNTLAGIELFMRALDGLGLTDQERVSVMMLTDAFVIGQARQRIQYGIQLAETGLSDDEFWAQQIPYLDTAMKTGDYPAMAALGEDAFGASWEQAFEFGLQRVLDGLEALIDRRRPA
jgi:AcrR family transcriptional regulator